MLKFLRALLVWGGTLGAIGAVVLTVGVLQEIRLDDLPERAERAGVTLPLQEPRIEVSLARGTLSLFDGEIRVKRYNIAYGKRVEGRVADRMGSTPIGEFKVVSRHKRENMLEWGSRFLMLDFPNLEYAAVAYDRDMISEADYDRIAHAIRNGQTPPFDTAVGGPFGIRGGMYFYHQTKSTEGSIAMSNGSINELFDHVPVGTPVIISRQ